MKFAQLGEAASVANASARSQDHPTPNRPDRRGCAHAYCASRHRVGHGPGKSTASTRRSVAPRSGGRPRPVAAGLCAARCHDGGSSAPVRLAMPLKGVRPAIRRAPTVSPPSAASRPHACSNRIESAAPVAVTSCSSISRARSAIDPAVAVVSKVLWPLSTSSSRSCAKVMRRLSSPIRRNTSSRLVACTVLLVLSPREQELPDLIGRASRCLRHSASTLHLVEQSECLVFGGPPPRHRPPRGQHRRGVQHVGRSAVCVHVGPPG